MFETEWHLQVVMTISLQGYSQGLLQPSHHHLRSVIATPIYRDHDVSSVNNNQVNIAPVFSRTESA